MFRLLYSIFLVYSSDLVMPRTSAPWEIERRIFVKAEDTTDPSFGCKPQERRAEDLLKYGVVNLDKPAGPSSHEVAAWVKRIVKLHRVGHGGTLGTWNESEKSQSDWCSANNVE